MNLECLNTIIADNLAIHIDLTNVNSWLNWNTGLTAFSLTKWSGAISDNINLLDFGLTAFDNGRTNVMWEGITVTPNDTYLSLYRVGYNTVINPTTGQTSGLTATTNFLTINPMTGGTYGNWFDCNGGYLNGFFKLKDYNYELFPSRYNYGITIETLVNLYPYSQGIFYMMGIRAGDKYIPTFSGETTTGVTTGGIRGIDGIVTSEENFLDSFISTEENKKAFSRPEDMKKTVYTQPTQIDNFKNNIIAFQLTPERRLAYKYINNDGLIVTNSSPTIITATGFTMIAITFTPDAPIDNPDPDVLNCAPQRIGTLVFYVNGRSVWTVNNFPEFYFHGFSNDREKQIGEPYTITWGGGSFGLDASYHYDYQTYVIYNGQDQSYLDTNFSIHESPLSGGTGFTTGLSVNADTGFTGNTVIRIEYTGTTGTTGNTYFLKFNNPVSIISNRDYDVEFFMYDNGFFNADGNNTISIIGYGDTTDISIMKSVEYQYPVFTPPPAYPPQNNNTQPFADEYEYVDRAGEMFYGETGTPVFDEYGNLITEPIYVPKPNTVVSGQGQWWKLTSTIRSEENSGQNFINLGILIETTTTFNTSAPLYIMGLKYTAADILVKPYQQSFINENFFMPFIGGIQKLRVYDKAFSSTEVLHNAFIESQSNPDIVVSKGGRIIYR